MTLQEVIGSGQLRDVGNEEFIVMLQNPLSANYAGLPDAGTRIPGFGGEELNGEVTLSIGGAGDIEVRPAGTDGGNERCVKQGNLLVYRTDGRRFVLPFAE